MKTGGKVWLAGAGPGDAQLLTVKARNLIEQADVIVYDALISTEILSLIPADTERIHVGKRANHHSVVQEEINKILLWEAQKGKKVLRLKGGDPFVFGRGGEELTLLIEAGIPFEIVPGITSAVSVPAYAGIPVTHRDYTSSFHVITGRAKSGHELAIDYEALVSLDATLVFLMGIGAMEEICQGLMKAGMHPDTPAAVLEKGTTARQRRVISTVARLKEDAEKNDIQTPAIIVVGKVCALADEFHWAEDRPLGGKQILVTRPKQFCSAMAARLRELGASVIELPSILTEPVSPNSGLRNALENIGKSESEWLVFTSPTGVDIFFEQLAEMKFDLRKILKNAETKFAVLGSGTKRALEKRGIFADVMPEVYSAEELGKVLAENVDVKEHVTILRAKEGSEMLTPPLGEKGIDYADIPLYETVCKADDSLKAKIEEMIAVGEIDWVTFTSASTVKGFVGTMQDMDYTKVHAFCIGEQTAKEAEKYGMQICISREATIESMIEGMLWENSL